MNVILVLMRAIRMQYVLITKEDICALVSTGIFLICYLLGYCILTNQYKQL